MTEKETVRFLAFRRFIFTVAKRTIDISGSLLLSLIFLPLMVVTAVLVKATSPGSIFFKQKRVGKNSYPFVMYKFRTMYTGDNDQRLKEGYPDLWKKYKENGWKLRMDEDPRITPVGKILRSLTIDEFPQLIFNVFPGQMSLVGPRAYREEELQEYEQKYPQTRQYINDIRSVKPGITGPWQTSGRNEIPFEQRAKLDSEYVRSRSLKKEILILFKTPLAMISRW
ncbi:MAG: sugar transferase [Candidatus Shapirobacteria bacterium]|jgi:lipopolysaccharide/colanic/teichoic acid biosynthesis glycosyltransferase